VVDVDVVFELPCLSVTVVSSDTVFVPSVPVVVEVVSLVVSPVLLSVVSLVVVSVVDPSGLACVSDDGVGVGPGVGPGDGPGDGFAVNVAVQVMSSCTTADLVVEVLSSSHFEKLYELPGETVTDSETPSLTWNGAVYVCEAPPPILYVKLPDPDGDVFKVTVCIWVSGAVVTAMVCSAVTSLNV